MKKRIIHSDKAPAPIGPYSQGVAFGNLLFLSGQIALDPVTGQVVMDNIEEETHRVMDNISALLTAAGLDFSHVLKSTIFLSNMDYFPKVNEVYGRFFIAGEAPARETVQVAKLPRNVNVEISVIAGFDKEQ